jgi:hypothetical protein
MRGCIMEYNNVYLNVIKRLSSVIILPVTIREQLLEGQLSHASEK